MDRRPVPVSEPAAVLRAAVLGLRPPLARDGHGRVRPDAAEAWEGVAPRPGAATHAARLSELAAEHVATVHSLAEAAAAALELLVRRYIFTPIAYSLSIVAVANDHSTGGPQR